MDTATISMRYAVGILDYAARYRLTHMVGDDARVLLDALDRYPALPRVLGNRLLDGQTKLEVIAECVAQGRKPSEAFLRAMEIVVANHREGMLDAICRDLIGLVEHMSGMIDVHITTAMEMDQALHLKMRLNLERMMKCGVNIVPHVDPSIIGGYILHWDTYLLDRSLKGKLNKIENSINGKYQG